MGCDVANTSNLLSGNSILMLSLVAESSKKAWLGITKLQKLSFLMEYYLSEQSKRAFGYRFFMYDHGPISKGVYNDYESLLDEELVVEDENGIQTSEAGNNINEQIKGSLPKEIETVMQYVVKRFAHMNTHELEKFVHNMKITLPSGLIARIDDLERGCIVLPESPENSFKVEKGYMETFNILANKSLREAIRVARKGSRSSPFQPLSS